MKMKERILWIGIIIILLCGIFIDSTIMPRTQTPTTVSTTQSIMMTQTVTTTATQQPSLSTATPFAVIPLNKGIAANYTSQGTVISVNFWSGNSLRVLYFSAPKLGVKVLAVITDCVIYQIQGSESLHPGTSTSYLGTYAKMISYDTAASRSMITENDTITSGYHYDGFMPTSTSVVYLYLLQAP